MRERLEVQRISFSDANLDDCLLEMTGKGGESALHSGIAGKLRFVQGDLPMSGPLLGILAAAAVVANTGGAAVEFQREIQPLLAGLAGRRLGELPRAALAGEVPADDENTRIVPVRWHGSRVRAISGSGPGHLGAAAQADALAIVPPTLLRTPTVELLLP